MAGKTITEFEPAIIKKVRKSGDLYVGREHVGKTAYVYFLREESKPFMEKPMTRKEFQEHQLEQKAKEQLKRHTERTTDGKIRN